MNKSQNVQRLHRLYRFPNAPRKIRVFLYPLGHRIKRYKRCTFGMISDPNKRCVVCNVRYHGWPESDYCSNECASEGHRICENPAKNRITFLRAQCRASWERSIRANGAESFETWLRNFEARLERMPPPNQNQQPMKSQSNSNNRMKLGPRELPKKPLKKDRPYFPEVRGRKWEDVENLFRLILLKDKSTPIRRVVVLNEDD